MLFQVLRCKSCGRLMTKTQMEFQSCSCGGIDGEPVTVNAENLTSVEMTLFNLGEYYVLCDHEFLRCNRELCGKLILTKHIKSGGCPCGSRKVRSINLNGYFTTEEWDQVLSGEAHSYDPLAVCINPDILNKDNKEYWARVAKEVDPVEYQKRLEAAHGS